MAAIMPRIMANFRYLRRLCVWAVLTAGCTASWAENPQAYFLAKYNDAMKKALASPSTNDDVFLAKSLLADADEQPFDIAVLLCRKAYDVAQASPAGADLAVEAMEQLAELDPTEQDSCLEHIFVLRKKQYDSASGKNRVELGREIIDVLQALASSKASQGQKDEADQLLRQAMSLVHATHSDRRREIEEQRKLLPKAAEASKQKQRLETILHSDSNDTAARADLVRLYIAYFDDPVAAEALLAPDLDETLRSYVPLLRREPGSLPPEVAQELAQWLRTLARDVPADRQKAVLDRACEFQNRVLAGMPETDPRRKSAAEEFCAIHKQLASLDAFPGGRSWSLNTAELGLVASPNLNQSMLKAREFLLRAQQPDGAWRPDDPNPLGLDRPGMTALVTYALLQNGLSPRDPKLRRSLSVLRNEESTNTQTLAFRCCVWALCRRELGLRYDRLLQQDAELLCRSSGNGGFEAIVDLDRPARRGDAYYTQWAVLALATAASEGVQVPRTFWNQNRAWWRRGQNEDGGWGRRTGRVSRPFFTAAGAVSLLIDGEQQGQSRAEALADRSVQRALLWVDQNFDLDDKYDRQLFLLTLARLGVARGQVNIGAKNWYDWLARELLRTQQPDGAWRPGRESTLASTALNLLTLSFAQGGR